MKDGSATYQSISVLKRSAARHALGRARFDLADSGSSRNVRVPKVSIAQVSRSSNHCLAASASNRFPISETVQARSELVGIDLYKKVTAE
jgi:hypothetical protein